MKIATGGRRLLGSFIIPTVAAIAFASAGVNGAAAETRGYVVEWFYPAMYTMPDNCPDGVNPLSNELLRNALKASGKTPQEVDNIINGLFGGGPGNLQGRAVPIIDRGRIAGKPVNIYANPLAGPDPGFKTAVGRYAYGFNLDGKGAASPNGFEDPETHELGVDNQLFRVYGCVQNHQAAPGTRPHYPPETWDAMRDEMPAWLITVTGADLGKDGDVTVRMERALDHVTRNARGEVMEDATFRVDPDPRSRNVLQGKIKDGVLTVAAPSVYLQADQYLMPEFAFKQFHMRLKLKDDGTGQGIVGGYLPWIEFYFEHAANGLNAEENRAMDMTGLFRSLMKMADAYPDPTTGRNTHISTAWWIEVLPAFVVNEGPEKTSQVADPGSVKLSSAH